MIWDFQGRITEANQAFLDIVGYAGRSRFQVGWDGQS